MAKINIDAFLDDEDFDTAQGKRIHRKNRRLTQREKRVRLQAELVELADKIPIDVQQTFTPSFLPHGHERVWLINYLEEFYNDNVITDVLGRVKGGKEANVYICAAHPKTGLDLIAAKVYRPRMFRNLRNDARYRQGRGMLDASGKPIQGRREALAVQKKTRFGQELRHGTWLGTEYQTMQLLWEAGVDVPKPIAQNDNVILMEYIGEQSAPAPTLNQVTLQAGEARVTFERLVENLELMLACRRVHGDLSAYNILYWEGQFRIIDFPQAVDPRRNPESMDLFVRDVERVCQYFARYHIALDARVLANDLWSRFRRTEFMEQEENFLPG
jgi:RIO kinase 1